MNQFYMKRSALILIMLALMISIVSPAFAVDSKPKVKEQIATTPSLGKVNIGGNNYIELKQANVLSGNEGKTVTFTIAIHNGGNSDLQFIDYWVRLQSKSGEQFSPRILPKDQDKNRIAAKSTEVISFYATVSSTTTLQNLIFQFIKWDFSQANFERSLGKITIPPTYSLKTPVNQKRMIDVMGTQIKTSVSKLAMSKSDKYLLPSITYSMENVGNKSITIPKYQFSLRTSEGLMYSLDIIDLEENTKIPPRVTEEIQLDGSIPLSVSATGWELIVTELDEASKISLPVAFYAIPKSTADISPVVTAVNKVKRIEIGTIPVDTSVTKVIKTSNEKYYVTTVYFTLKNAGAKSVKVPKYELSILTSDGLSYPISTTALDAVTVDPLVSKEIKFNVNIPAKVNANNWKLVLSPPAVVDDSGNKKSTATTTPIATYQLPNSSQEEIILGKEVEVSNKNGIYGVQLNSVQRLPLDERDIVTADVSLLNNGTSSLPIPEISGYFLLDGSIKVPATTLKKDNVIALKEKSQVNLQLYGTIPFTYEYSSIKLVLQEKVDEETLSDLVEFKHNSEVLSIPVINSGGTYSLDGVGQRAAVSIRSVRTYEGTNADLYTVQVNVKNMEKRFSNVATLVGYFKTKDDLMFPTTISEVKDRISPLGTATLNVTTTLPKDFDRSGMNLILGEKIVDDKVENAYVDAVSFTLPVEDKVAKDHFNEIDMFPYTLTLNHLKVDFPDTTHYRLKFDYVLSKDLLIESGATEHKLIIEFKDAAGNINEELVFELGKDMKLGTDSKEIITEDAQLVYKIPYFKNYVIKVYDEYQGQKKLLAEKSFN